MSGDLRGDVFGLVDGLGDSYIIGPLNNVEFRNNLGDLGSVFNNGATKSLNLEGLDILWSNSSIGDGCRDVEVDFGVYSGNCTSVYSWCNSSWCNGSWSNGSWGNSMSSQYSWGKSMSKGNSLNLSIFFF